MEFIVIALLLALTVLLVLAFLILYQLIQQAGRIVLRLEAIESLGGLLSTPGEAAVEEYVATLPAGVPAPTIRLPDLNGAQRNLSEWRGRRVLLVFFDPQCAFSQALLPSLVALTVDTVPDRPVPVVITTGTLEANLALFDEVGFSSQVLLQSGTEVAAAYKVDGTPMSYLIDADGTIAAEIAVGIQATLILAGDIAAVADATSMSPDAIDPTDPLPAPTAGLRDGLQPGATAPIFRLPRIDGGELSLLDVRGKPAVVVFFDPECGPCDALAPLLESAHRRPSTPDILMISRGDIEATRAKVAEFGLTFPVGMQRHWEISRQYGIFATPAAFLIDEWGLIAAEVAVGNDRIMQLIEAAERSD